MELKELPPTRLLRVYAPWSSTYSAITDYRLHKPFTAMHRKNMVAFLLDHGGTSGAINSSNRVRIMEGADVQIWHMILSVTLLKLALQPPESRPLIIHSVDDLSEYCSPFNPAYMNLGTRDPSGEPLDPDGPGLYYGDRLLWQNGKDYGGRRFDIKKNIERLTLSKTIMHESDGVVVTCEALAQEVRRYGCENVFVYPNHVSFDAYPPVELAEHPDEVRVLWQGGYAHYEDFHEIAEPLKRVMNRHPKAKLIFWGQDWKLVSEHVPNFRYIEWLPYPAFLSTLSTIGHDISLCPLSINKFNECKSAIKFYESSAISCPAATLARNFGPYQEVIHNDTGLLYDTPDEFEERLEALILDAELRKRLSKRAAEWVHEYRDIEKGIVPYYEWLSKTYKTYKGGNGQVSQPEVAGLVGATQ